MDKIVLISCASKKLDRRAIAKEMYISPLFRFSLNYAYRLNPRSVYVLSAKYGLTDLEREIEPYNLTLNQMRDIEIQNWARQVLSDLSKVSELARDNFVFLAGERYRRHLIPALSNFSVPLQ